MKNRNIFIQPTINILIFDEEDNIVMESMATAGFAVTKRNDALVDLNIAAPVITNYDSN